MEFYSTLFTRQEELNPGPILACPRTRESYPDDERNAIVALHGGGGLAGSILDGGQRGSRPDGLTAGFYHFHWEASSPSITATVLDFLNGGELPVSMNNTTIVLIPKVKNP